jgi:hypothetical protein
MGKQGPKKGHVGVLTYEKDATIITWILVMQECELSITL